MAGESPTRALIGGLDHDIPAEPEALRKLVPQRLLTYREAVEAVLAAANQGNGLW